MRPAPGAVSMQWLALPVLVAVLAAPSSWAVALLLAALAVRGTAFAVRRLHRRRSDRRELAGALALGRDDRGRAVALHESQLAAHGLIVGASGAGKSTTLLGIVGEQVLRGRPVVAIDLKGSPAFAERLAEVARVAGRPLVVWSPDGPAGWNPLATGNATELKDKLIATERFTEPHYQRAAERYVQIALQTLHARGAPVALAEVVALMEPRRLAAAGRELRGPFGEHVQDYVASLTRDQLSAVRGLGTRLALLSESTAGPFLRGGAPAVGAGCGRRPVVDLRRALDGGAVVLFSLNSARYGQLAAQIGTLAIQDLVGATGHRLTQAAPDGARRPLATIAIDEFSALRSDQLLALLARGREAGVSVLLATQELSDLERAGRGFRDQVLGLTALKIAHRQDVPASARTLAEMAGSRWEWDETRSFGGPLGPRPHTAGTRRLVERPLVHPDEIARLPTGRAVLLTKTPVASVRRVAIDPGAGRGSDQPAPGVTR